jgi:hypothetical protein
MARMRGAFIQHLKLSGREFLAQALLKLGGSELAHLNPPARRF